LFYYCFRPCFLIIHKISPSAGHNTTTEMAHQQESRHSVISNMSHFWRTRAASTSSTPSGAQPGKTVVVPLFLSTSRSSTRNNLFSRGAVPRTARSPTSTRSVIESTHQRAERVQPLSIPSTEDQEDPNLYTASVAEITVPERTHHQRRRNVCERSTATNPSCRRPPRSARSGSHSTANSSRRSSRSRSIFSRSAYRDPKVNAKAKISFAFGITLLTAITICMFTSPRLNI
jgi:hypothetical protein